MRLAAQRTLRSAAPQPPAWRAPAAARRGACSRTPPPPPHAAAASSSSSAGAEPQEPPLPPLDEGETPYTKASFPLAAWPPGLNTPRRRLGLRGAALGLLRLAPGEGASHTHRHTHQEEVYCVLEGAAEAVVGGDRVTLVRRAARPFLAQSR
jgi:hypothetical protein